MQVSLPYLFVTALLAAPVGALLLVAHLRWSRPGLLLLGVVGGTAAMLWLRFILVEIDQDFIGWYKPAAWAIALLAGYAAATVLAHGWQFLRWARKP